MHNKLEEMRQLLAAAEQATADALQKAEAEAKRKREAEQEKLREAEGERQAKIALQLEAQAELKQLQQKIEDAENQQVRLAAIGMDVPVFVFMVG